MALDTTADALPEVQRARYVTLADRRQSSRNNTRLTQYIALSSSPRHGHSVLGADQPRVQVQLPPNTFFERELSLQVLLEITRKRCSYTVKLSSKQTADYSAVFLSLLLLPLARGQIRQSILPLYRENIPWLLDTCLDLLNAAPEQTQPAFADIMMKATMRLITQEGQTLLDAAIVVKSTVALILICVHVVRNLWPIFAREDGEKTERLCLAIAQIAESSLDHEDVHRLAQLQLVAELELRFPHHAADEDAEPDIFVSRGIRISCIIADVFRHVSSF